MLRIIKNKSRRFRAALQILPEEFVEVITFGYLTLDGFKIIKWKVNWCCCLVFFGHHLVIVLSLGRLTTNWVERYYARDN